jgi:predicted GIY-YIG superfamily endonuclease
LSTIVLRWHRSTSSNAQTAATTSAARRTWGLASSSISSGSARCTPLVGCTLLWAAEFENVVDAFAFEKQVQNWSRAKREALIDGRLGDLPGLARGRTGYMKRGPTPGPTSPGLV